MNINFADRRRSYTKAFERYALDLSRHMTIKDVAAHLGVSWDVIKKIQKRNLLMDWITYAESTGIRMLKDFAKTLRCHAWGILAWYDYSISTAALEGTNNKIKTMKRQAYGFRDADKPQNVLG